MASSPSDRDRRRRSVLIALALSAAALAGFVGWTLFIAPAAEPPAFDRQTAEAMREFAEEQPAVRDGFVAVTFLGGVPFLTALAAVGVLGSLALGQRELALVWLLAAAGGGLLDLFLKTSLDRPRPPAQLRDAAVHEQNESYPSGHAMGAIIGWGMLAYAGCRVLRRRRWRTLLLVGVTMLILLIGASRIVLRAHWLSDVIGGFLIGGSWLALRIAVISAAPPAQEKSPGD